MNRNEFIRIAIAGAGNLLLLPSCARSINPYRFFSIEEADCVIALSEQIIPADDEWPGATYACVINYIDKQLVEVFIEDQSKYRTGIKALQLTSQKMYGKDFEELNFDVQMAFLHKIEKNEINEDSWQDYKPSDFFNMVINHTMQGYYSSPRHGGNRNYISYRMLDLSYPLIVGQNRYRGVNGE
jgi:gluconate 2-dehydrogenase gamma chain